MRDNWCDWCMVFRCAWAKVVELDLHQRCMLGTCLRMWPRKCPGSPYILCLCLPETSVCQRYSNVSSALMGKELKDSLTSYLWTYSRPLTFTIFMFQHKSKILGAGFCNWGLWKISISWQEGGRCIADLHTHLTRCRFCQSVILSFFSSCERSKSGQASAFVKYFGAGEVRNSEMDWKLLNLLKLLEVIQVIQVSNVSKLGGFGCDKCYETRAAWYRNLGPWQRGRIAFNIFQH